MDGSIVVSEVVKRFLARSKQGGILNDMRSLIMQGITSEKGSVSLPVLQRTFELFPAYKESCIKIYHGLFGLNPLVTEIPDSIKAAQGAVLDGLCILYDWNAGKMLGIVTLNNRLICKDEEDIIDSKLEDKIMELNKIGLIHSLRYDFEYVSYGPDTANVKCVKHRTKVDEENVILIPLVSTLAIELIIHAQMQKGRMIAVRTVSASGEEKQRVVTENYEHLAHYCDSEAACKDLKCEYFDLGCFMYAPVVGARSTTAMKTRIDILNLETIVSVANYQQCARFGIQKVKDPVDALFKEQAILITLSAMRTNDPDGYTRVVNKLPDSHVFRNMMDGDIGQKTLSNYIHTLTDGRVTALLKSIPGASEAYETRKSLVGEAEDGSGVRSITVDQSNIRSVLRDSIVKIVWKKSNGVYASCVGTNSRKILQKVYGDDYYCKYESVGVRISSAIDDIKELGMPIDVACKSYGFDENTYNKILALGNETKQPLEDCFYEALGKKKRASSNNPDLVTVRTLDAYLGSKADEGQTVFKAEGYYVSVDISHMVRAEVIG